MKSTKFFLVALVATLLVSIAACSDDKDEPAVNDELVSQAVPTKDGWSGNFENGVAKFIDLYDYEDDDAVTYMAFSFKNGVCVDGVVNIVMASDDYAKRLEKMLKSGVWDDFEDDEEDDDYYRSCAPSLKVTRSIMHSASNSRSGAEALPINVSRKGKVVYLQIPNVKGLSATDVQNAVKLWNGEYYIPSKVVFGKYENGVYTCNNMRGIGMDYRIDTEFSNSGYCTKFVTTVSFSTRGWAQMMYEQLYESIEDNSNEIISLFGKTPDLSIDGSRVRLEAVIAGDIDRDTIEKYIAVLDWENNCPILWDLFY